MQKLHLVGFTADFDGLIFSARKGAKSGSFVVPLDGRLLKQIAEAQQRRDGGSGGASRVEERLSSPRLVRPESSLSPREMQDRIRAGWTLDEVAAEAGVDLDWVRRFASPVLAEVGRVVDRSRSAVYDKPRFGLSSLPLGAAVRRNVLDRGVRLLDEELDDCWSAYQLDEDLWVVRFAYTSRGRSQEAEWAFDLETGELVSRNRLAAQLGHVATGRRRTTAPATSSVPKPTKKAAKRPTSKPAARVAPAPKPVKAAKAVKAVKATKAVKKQAAARAASTKPAKRATTRKAAAKKAPAAGAAAPTRTPATAGRTTSTSSTSSSTSRATTSSRSTTTPGARSTGRAAATTSRPVGRATSPSGTGTAARSTPGTSRPSGTPATAGTRSTSGRPSGGPSTRPATTPSHRSGPGAPSGSGSVAGGRAGSSAVAATGAGRVGTTDGVAPSDRSAAAFGRAGSGGASRPAGGAAASSGRDRRPEAEVVRSPLPAPTPPIVVAADQAPEPVSPPLRQQDWPTDPAMPRWEPPDDPTDRRPAPGPASVPDAAREAVATPFGDEFEPPRPGAAVDPDTGVARIDSRRTSKYVSAPPPRPTFRGDVTRVAPEPAPAPRRPRRTEPLRGR